MTSGVIIQARTHSTRFPKKVLKSLPYASSLTVLDQVITRVKRTKLVDEIILATSMNSEDNEIVDIARRNETQVFRGSEEDVLDRFYQAAKSRNLDIIIRITGDCPCIDWNIIDMMIKEFEKGKYDYLSNTLKRTFPHGLDVEIFSFNALAKTFKEAKKQEFREHVSLYIYKTEGFRIGNLEAPPSYFAPNIRITLDTLEDYALICAVYDFLYTSKPDFDCRDIINLFNDKSWLYLINKNISQKRVFNSLENEVVEALKLLELQELKKAKDFLNRKFYGNE